MLQTLLAAGRRVFQPKTSTPPSRDTGARDDGWMARIREGDEAALEALYTAYAESLIRFATTYVSDSGMAREVVNDIFLSIWERRAEGVARGGAAAYLFAAVRNRAHNVVRAEARQQLYAARAAAESNMDASASAADTETDAASDVAEVDRMLASLSHERRRILLLRWRYEMTPEEIAAATGMSRNAVYLSIQRSLETLRRLFRET